MPALPCRDWRDRLRRVTQCCREDDPHSSMGAITTSGTPSTNRTFTSHGLQQTSQSSTYSCTGPPPGSTAIVTVSPQYGQTTSAVVSAVPSPSGKSASISESSLSPLFLMRPGHPPSRTQPPSEAEAHAHARYA